MKAIICSLLLLLTGALTACSSKENFDDTLRDAEAAIARGDMTAATSVAEALTDSASLRQLSVRQLGRLSIIYMQLADSADNADNVAIASDAYRRAFDRDRDSAVMFYSSLSSDQLPYTMMLSAITGSHDNPAELDEIEPADSTDIYTEQ